MPSTLGYWTYRGLGQPIRCLLTYVGEEFVDKRYLLEHPIEEGWNAWLREKFNLGLDFPNVPYYIDGDRKMTQNIAIMRYLGRKYKLAAQTEEERRRLDVVEQHVDDLRMSLAFVCYLTDGFEAGKQSLLQMLPSRLQTLDHYMKDKQWMLGDRLTYVDFVAYDALDFNQIFKPGCLDDFPNLKNFMARFENIPKVKQYMESSKFVRWPLFSPASSFGFDRRNE